MPLRGRLFLRSGALFSIYVDFCNRLYYNIIIIYERRNGMGYRGRRKSGKSSRSPSRPSKKQANPAAHDAYARLAGKVEAIERGSRYSDDRIYEKKSRAARKFDRYTHMGRDREEDP